MKRKHHNIPEDELTSDRFEKPHITWPSLYRNGNMLINASMGSLARSVNITHLLNLAKEFSVDVDKGLEWLNEGFGYFGPNPYSGSDISLLIRAKELGIDFHNDTKIFGSETSSSEQSISNRDKLSLLVQAKELGIDADKELKLLGLRMSDNYSILRLLVLFKESNRNLQKMLNFIAVCFSLRQTINPTLAISTGISDGATRLRSVSPSTSKNVSNLPVFDEVDTCRVVGRAGEYLVKYKLMLHGYEVLSPALDDGIDHIVRIGNMSFHIQVKTSMQNRHGQYCLWIKKNALNRHRGKNVFYVLVLIDRQKNEKCLVLPYNVVEQIIQNQNTSAGSSRYKIKCCIDAEDVFVGRDNRSFYLNNWGLIRKFSTFQN